MKRCIAGILTLFFVTAVAHADESLVTRNDFICYDTTFMNVSGCYAGSQWPGIALDFQGAAYK